MQKYKIEVENLGIRAKRDSMTMNASNIDNLRKNLLAKGIANSKTKVYISKIPSDGTIPRWIGVLSFAEHIDEQNRILEFLPSWYGENGFEYWISPKTGKLAGRY